MNWDRWGRRLLVAGLAVLTGTFARRVYDVKVREVGRAFAAGERTARGGQFTCQGCGARFPVLAGGTVPSCPTCAGSHAIKSG